MLESRAVNLNALRMSSEKMACYTRTSELAFTYLYAGSSIQNASEQFISRIHLSFWNFASSRPTDKNLRELDLEIQSGLSRQPFRIRHMFIWTFFLTLAVTTTFQNIDLSSWITLSKVKFTLKQATKA